MTVAKENEAQTEIIETVKAQKTITIQNLLRYTSWLSYGLFSKQPAFRKTYSTAQISTSGVSSEEFVDNLAKLPLKGEPGKVWEYSYSTDVLDRIVEVISGQRLGEFLKENIFDPLGMGNTGFFMHKAKIDRVAQYYDSFTKSIQPIY
jgi:CubicO group peptidase (beta-lactamase class C family)